MLKTALRSMFGLRRRAAPKIHGPSEPHEWTPIPGLEAFPQRLCRCGMMKTYVQAGDHTVTMSPGGNNLIRWSALTNPQAAGDIAINPSGGRPVAFMNGHINSSDSPGAGGYRNQWTILNNYQSTTVASIGPAPALTQNGAVSGSVGSAFNGNVYTSAAVANSDAGWITALDFSTNHSFSLGFVFRLGSDITNVRFWIGAFNASPMGSSTPLEAVGFRYDTSVDGTTFWRAYSAGAVSSNLVTTTIPVVANGTYFARIDETLSGGSTPICYLSIQEIDVNNNALIGNVATFSTNLPSGGANLLANMQVRTLVAVAKSIDLTVIDNKRGLNMEL